MAISTTITTMQGLSDWFESLGYFDVSYENDTITLKDGDNNTLATAAKSGNDCVIALYTASGTNASLPGYNFSTFTGIKCSGGAVLYFNMSGDIPLPNGCIAISKNQSNNIVFAYHADAGGSLPYYYDTSYRAVSWNDVSVSTYQTDMRIMSQTILVPICTRPQSGQSSYCENAFLMYATQSAAIGQFMLNGSFYYSTGWFAIKDDSTAS